MLSSLWRMFAVCYLNPAPPRRTLQSACGVCPGALRLGRGLGGRPGGLWEPRLLSISRQRNQEIARVQKFPQDPHPEPGRGCCGASHARGRRGMVTCLPRRELWALWGPVRNLPPAQFRPLSGDTPTSTVPLINVSVANLTFGSFGHVQFVRFDNGASP